MRARPAIVGLKSKLSMSIFGTYASAAKNAPATRPRISTTLGSRGAARSDPAGSSGLMANAMTTIETRASGQPIAGAASAANPTATAAIATTTARRIRRPIRPPSATAAS